jgi:hypothetical protein
MTLLKEEAGERESGLSCEVEVDCWLSSFRGWYSISSLRGKVLMVDEEEERILCCVAGIL